MPAESKVVARIGKASITKRELEVMELVAEGLTNREIGARLYLSPDTVKTHLYQLFGKIGAKNRTHAAYIFYKAGIFKTGAESVNSPSDAGISARIQCNAPCCRLRS